MYHIKKKQLDKALAVFNMVLFKQIYFSFCVKGFPNALKSSDRSLANQKYLRKKNKYNKYPSTMFTLSCIDKASNVMHAYVAALA